MDVFPLSACEIGKKKPEQGIAGAPARGNQQALYNYNSNTQPGGHSARQWIFLPNGFSAGWRRNVQDSGLNTALPCPGRGSC